MITLQCLLEFKNKQDKEIVLDLMYRFSSTTKYAYKRLLEGESCFESYRDFSPLKRVMISRDWVRMANRLVPVLGAGNNYTKMFKQFYTV